MNRISPLEPFPSDPAAPMRLVDLSLVARFGAKGKDTPAWAASAGLTLPEAPNQAARHMQGKTQGKTQGETQGGLVARLSVGEVLLLGDPGAGADNAWIETAAQHLGAGRGMCFALPRADSHCWFAVLGEHAPAMFAKVCGVDLRPRAFADLQVAQTSVARLNAIVIRDDQTFKDKSEFPSYHVLADWPSARSLWGYLLDAMAEFDGRPVLGVDLA